MFSNSLARTMRETLKFPVEIPVQTFGPFGN
jgi:hypothetical protein